MYDPEAFLLLTLPNCSLSSKDFSESGTLGLECVTVPIPDASGPSDREVYLVLRLNTSEIPIDPARVIERSDTPVARVYTFHGTPSDPTELILTVATVTGDSKHDPLFEDLDTLHGLLEQYALDFRPSTSSTSSPRTQIQAPLNQQPPPPEYVSDIKDLRGQLVMINEETGELVGQVEDRFRIREDPVMYERGHENDPVVIDVPDEAGLRESDINVMEAFARVVPPDQQDWITKSATVVSHAISYTTNLLLTTITSASSHYISKSAPSPHHSANLTTNNQGTVSPNPRAPSPTPPPVPPRALVFLTSERTRRGLRNVHTVSGQAVKVSAKTVKTIDNMIRRAMGAKPKENRRELFGRSTSSVPPSTSTSPIPVPYTPRVARKAAPVHGSTTSALQPGEWNPDSKPPLPPRYAPNSAPGSPQPPSAQFSPALPPRSRSRPPSPQPPSLPPRNLYLSPTPPQTYTSPPQQYASPPSQYASPQQPSLSPQLNAISPQPKLSTGRRILISADLVLSTIDHSTRRILDNGTNNLGRVMHHKYGPEVAESSLLMAGTARNVGLVYVDMKGIGRRALLRKAGMGFVSGKSQGDQSSSRRPVPPVPEK